MKCDTSGLTFVFGPSAGLYSTMASVLAGFAFLAITLVIGGTHRRSANRPTTGAEHARSQGADVDLLIILTIAFTSLILTSIQYAEIAGETGCAITDGRSASEQFLAGVSFVFSVLLLFYATVQMISASGISNVGHSIRRLVAVIGPALAMLLLAAAADEVAFTPWIGGKATTTGLAGFIESPWTNLGLVGFVLLLSFVIWRVPVTFPGFGAKVRERSEGRNLQRLFPYISLLIALLCVLRVNTFSELHPTDKIGEQELVAWLAFCAAGLLAQSALLSFQRVDHVSNKGRAKSEEA
jgi:hypothetical protein